MARPSLRKSWTLCLILLAAVAVCLFVVWRVPPSRTQVSPAAEHALVGTWVLQGSGTHFVAFERDGTLRVTDFPVPSGANPSTGKGRWGVEGGELVFEEEPRGVLNTLERVFGGGPREERIAILSVTDDELRFGDPENPVVYKRYDGSPTDFVKPR